MKNLFAWFLAALLLPWSVPAVAQQVPLANVVSSCGTASYPAGQTRPITQDTTGLQCNNSAASSTAQNVNPDSVVDGTTNSTTVSSATTGWSGSTQGYGSISFEIIGNASGNSIVIEGSNDGGTTWGGIAVRPSISAASGNQGTTISTTASGTTYITTTVMPMMRWRVSNYISGSTTIAVGFKRNSPPNTVDAFVANNTSNAIPIALAPSANSATAVTPVIGAAVSNLQGKTSAGNLYDAYLTNNSGAVAYFYAFNSASNPSTGAVTAGTASGNYQDCIAVPSGGTGSLTYTDLPERFSAGIWFTTSSAACGTNTAVSSGIVIHGRVQ